MIFVSDAALEHRESLRTMDNLNKETSQLSFNCDGFLEAPDSGDKPANLFSQCKSCLLPLLHVIAV